MYITKSGFSAQMRFANWYFRHTTEKTMLKKDSFISILQKTIQLHGSTFKSEQIKVKNTTVHVGSML